MLCVKYWVKTKNYRLEILQLKRKLKTLTFGIHKHDFIKSYKKTLSSLWAMYNGLSSSA